MMTRSFRHLTLRELFTSNFAPITSNDSACEVSFGCVKEAHMSRVVSGAEDCNTCSLLLQSQPIMAYVNLASSSSIPTLNHATNSTTVSFTFNTPVKLDQSNYLIWRSQVLASIRGNRLEKFIDDAVTPPPSHIAQRVDDELRSVENPEFITWRSQDQVLLGWLLSSMSEGIISLVFNLEMSLEVWKAIKVQFGSQSKSRLLHLRYMMNSTRKDDMKIRDYFIKMKNIADNMAAAGSTLSSDDLILHVLSGLGPYYNSVATYITGQVGVCKMNVNEAYAMLLTQEARIEQQSQMLVGVDMKNNFKANYAQNRGVKKGNMSAGRGFGGYGHNSGFGNGGYYKGSFGTDSAGAGIGFNTQFKSYQSGNQRGGGGVEHFKTYLPNLSQAWTYCKHLLEAGRIHCSGSYRSPPNRGPKAAYLANMDAPADTNWYLDSGATHHLTNDMRNMNMAEPFAGTSKLVIGNGVGLFITHTGSAVLRMQSSINHFDLKLNNILLVPKITKNLISISKLTRDNDVVVEFTNDFYFVKDKSMPSKSSDFLYNSLQVYHILVPNSNQNPLEVAPADTDSHASSSTHNIISLPLPTSPVHSTSLPSPNNSISSPIVHTTSPAATINTTPLSVILNITTSPTILQTSHSRSLPSLPKSIVSTNSMITRAKVGIFKPKAFLTDHNSLEPSNVGEALSDTKWKAVMQDEYDALIRNKTWSLVPMNPEYKLVGCKWVFRTKYNTDGSISKYKARLVAKGFHQTAGIDYSETFSPVVKSSIVRPESFVSEGGYICKLNKALYGLKQAPRAWHDVKGIILILIYVDDILITGPDSDLLESFIAKLSKVFALKDLGLVTYFLGVEVSYTYHGMHLSQTKYIKDLLSKASMQDCKGTDTHFNTSYKLERSTKGSLGAEFENPTLYRSIVGGLQYLILTKPDIAYSVHKLSQYLSAPTLQHWKSIGAYCIFLGNNLVSWSLKKQAIVAKSSTESEYRALLAASSELSWLQSLFSELNITKLPASVLWCDNQSPGDLARNPVFHSKSKHIELDIHYIRDKVLNKELEFRYITTEEQVTDVLTKPLSFPKFSYFRSELNVFSRPLSLRGDVKEAHMSRVVSGAEDCNTCNLLLQVDDMAC
ncbi:retrovirus-related pol polyprotein from transposon RE2 [Citrus sinensis]|uniref:Retrovirus-related pol polyprotein from transposon RE2 n=1 Tax=Citrus sinensis TaxID=2711 RepID=A0ACB8M0U7_CITSI|nr:retrovirus-related pol polyprotein from transposon RE2 [Citrus sinensis]